MKTKTVEREKKRKRNHMSSFPDDEGSLHLLRSVHSL